ncbi:MAG: four helix bundle protein [Verrucomicrobiales bacterium]|jgi:four helix bundle protein
MALQTFEDLEVWKRSCRLAVEICAHVYRWKNYGLKDQIQRSAISISSNIAEGAERDSAGDFKRFLRISKGSCAELRTQLYIAQRLAENVEDTNLKTPDSFIAETKEIAAMLQGLLRSIDRSNSTEN